MKMAYLVALALLLAAPFVIAQEEQQTDTQASDQTSSPSAETEEQDSSASDSTSTPASESSASGEDVTVSEPSSQAPEAGTATDSSSSQTAEQDTAQQPEIIAVPGPTETQPAPVTQIPEGCKEVKDETGFVKVVCEARPMECPKYSGEEIKKCELNNGKPNFFADRRGCKIFECRFRQESGQFMQEVKCPSEEERQIISEKCKSNNMDSIVRRDYNGCKYVECVSSSRESCPSSEDWERISRDCAKKGGVTVTGYDRGCNIPKCELRGQGIGEMQGGACMNVQKEVFDRCRNEGGEMIVKEDKGCITYAKCINRGDERRIEYEQAEEVPQSSVLLSLAFKLEQLKMDFDKLAKQTDQIADYYAASGDKSSEERFRKVSSMFIGAKQKVDDIKNKMRERISSLAKDDISDFRHDIKYIREVVIQDILYVMLSTEGASGAASAGKASLEGCGSDGSCFNKALRICEKTTFYPEGRSGPEITIDGLEGKNCVIKASVSTPSGSKDMVCKYPNYVMGMGGPEDLLPYCEGSMVEMAKQYSGGQDNRGIGREPAGSREREFQPRDREGFPMEGEIEPIKAVRQEGVEPIERAPFEEGIGEFPQRAEGEKQLL